MKYEIEFIQPRGYYEELLEEAKAEYEEAPCDYTADDVERAECALAIWDSYDGCGVIEFVADWEKRAYIKKLRWAFFDVFVSEESGDIVVDQIV